VQSIISRFFGLKFPRSRARGRGSGNEFLRSYSSFAKFALNFDVLLKAYLYFSFDFWASIIAVWNALCSSAWDEIFLV